MRGGIADNGKIRRTDVYYKAGKFYIVPVYTYQLMNKIQPNKAIVAHKSEYDWIEIDSSYDFLFSLYKNDLMEIRRKNDRFIGYCRGCHRDNGNLFISPPNINIESKRSIGVKNALEIIKYEMSILGEYRPIVKEVRRGLANSGGLEPSQSEDRG